MRGVSNALIQFRWPGFLALRLWDLCDSGGAEVVSRNSQRGSRVETH